MNIYQNVVEQCMSLSYENSDTFRQAGAAMIEAVLRSEPVAIPEFMLQSIYQMPPQGAGQLALLFGILVEKGMEPNQTGPVVVNLLRSWLDVFEPDLTGHLSHDLANVAREDAFPPLCTSVVTHLVRMPLFRKTLQADERFVEQLARAANLVQGITWVQELIKRHDGQLLVLHPSSQRVLKLRFENVGSCYHLFSLLQGELGTRLPDGQEPDPSVLAAAMGDYTTTVNDHAWWHYGEPFGRVASDSAAIWGQACVSHIPMIGEYHVMVLWPANKDRCIWDSGSFGPCLSPATPGVFLEEELSHQDAQKWFRRLGINTSCFMTHAEPEAQRPWWNL